MSRLSLALAILLLPTATAPAADPPPPFSELARPLLAGYCTRCHDAKKQEGGIDLASFPDDASALARRKLWKRALARVRAGEMPPEGAKQLPAADKEKLTKWL